MGIWYAFKGELFLFLMSAFVDLQHECAHAFAAAKLGYRLNAVVLMPFGAVIDGDLKGLSLKDEIFVALCGPLCNLVTATFFVALWWFTPTAYAFTDTAFYASLAIGVINFLPAYPLDGGRILYCFLARGFLKNNPEEGRAEKKAKKICKLVTLLLSLLLLLLFALSCWKGTPNFSLLAFVGFLLFGGAGNKTPTAYEKLPLPLPPPLKKGVEVRRVAIAKECPVKDALRFLSKGSYLVLEVYGEGSEPLFLLPQNLLEELFALSATPYETLEALWKKWKNGQKKGVLG